jgi:hypothetical protein
VPSVRIIGLRPAGSTARLSAGRRQHVTALATLGLLALVVWMDAADKSAEFAGWVIAGLLVAMGVAGLVAWAWRTWFGVSS